DLRSSASIRDRRIKFSRLTGYLFPGNLMAHPGKLIQILQRKIGRPPRRQPRKKIEGETKMKVKSSRGIVMKLICCAALVVLSSAVAFSATPTSGALLTIDGTAGTDAVHVKIYDSQIHSGVVLAVPQCSAADQIPND